MGNHLAQDLLKLARKFPSKNSNRIATFELSRFCNRRCSYCEVPNLYNSAQELSIQEAKGIVTWLSNSGYQILTCLGGEILTHHENKDGKALVGMTLELIKHATELGMFTNVTSNGDYVNEEIIKELSAAGLKSIAFSLHTYSLTSLKRLISLCKLASHFKIVPTISLTFTSETAKHIPFVAFQAAINGILTSINICQDHGSEFSTSRHDLVPTLEQQNQVLRFLSKLKSFGFVRTNRNYLAKAPRYYKNNWRCNSESDEFIHISATGFLNICSEVRTPINVLNSNLSLQSPEWREIKKTLVSNCHNCLHQCYFESQNPDPFGDIPNLIAGFFILTGQEKVVQFWAKHFVGLFFRQKPISYLL